MISRVRMAQRRPGQPKFAKKDRHELSTRDIFLVVSVLVNIFLLWSVIDLRYFSQKDESRSFFTDQDPSHPQNLRPPHQNNIARQIPNPNILENIESINNIDNNNANNIETNNIDTAHNSAISSQHTQKSQSIRNNNENYDINGKLFIRSIKPGNIPENSNPNPPLPNDNFMELSRDHRPYYTVTETEMNLWFHNKLFVFEDSAYNKKTAFCVIEKNSCTMFKQIFKRIRGKSDYLSTDYTRIHWLPYRGLEDISFYNMDNILRVMNDPSIYFAAFVRDPLERLVSGYVDKCEKKRGVNLCDYVRWSPIFKAKYGANKHYNDVGRSWTPDFYMWADGLILCPCWPETDKHFAPQSNFCNLYQYIDRYDVFRFENRTHRKTWMKRAGFWDQYGKSGWSTGGSDGTSIVDYGPQSHSSTNKDRVASKYIKYYEQNSTVTALLINKYRIDYITFGLQMQDWICDPKIKKTAVLKAALRSLPRHTRPPCYDLKWLWIPE